MSIDLDYSGTWAFSYDIVLYGDARTTHDVCRNVQVFRLPYVTQFLTLHVKAVLAGG